LNTTLNLQTILNNSNMNFASVNATGKISGLNLTFVNAGATTTTNTLCYLAVGGGQEVVNCTGSSMRYKQNITPIDIGLNEVLKLNPVNFYYIPNYTTDNGKQVGFIAEQVANVSNDLVIYNENGVIQTVRYDKMSALLTKAIQEQEAIINQQNATIHLLKSELCKKDNTYSWC